MSKICLKDTIKSYPIAHKSVKKIRYLLNSLVSKQKVAMFHFGRSGSTVLGNMLREYPDIHWVGEIFSKSGLKGAPEKISAKQWRNEHTYMTRKSSFGFETKYLTIQQLGTPAINSSLDEYMKDLDSLNFSKYILLDRQNHLRVLISSLVSQKSGEWQTKKKRTDVQHIHVNLKSDKLPILTTLIQMREQRAKLLELLGEKHFLLLEYETDIFKNPVVAYEKVCVFLGHKPKKIAPDLAQMNPFPIQEIVLNFEQLEKELKNTEFEWMLYE